MNIKHTIGVFAITCAALSPLAIGGVANAAGATSCPSGTTLQQLPIGPGGSLVGVCQTAAQANSGGAGVGGGLGADPDGPAAPPVQPAAPQAPAPAAPVTQSAPKTSTGRPATNTATSNKSAGANVTAPDAPTAAPSSTVPSLPATVTSSAPAATTVDNASPAKGAIIDTAVVHRTSAWPASRVSAWAGVSLAAVLLVLALLVKAGVATAAAGAGLGGKLSAGARRVFTFGRK